MTWYQGLRNPRVRDEASYIVREFENKKHIEIGGVLTEDLEGVEFMYAEGQLLVREQYLPLVERVLAARGRAEIIKRVIRDIVLVRVIFAPGKGPADAEGNDSTPEGNEGTDRPAEGNDSTSEGNEGGDRPAEGNSTQPEPEQPTLLSLLDEIDAELGPGIATLDHVLTVAENPSPCPATEPEEPNDPAPYPPACPDGGHRVRIYVADTGIVKPTVNSAEFSWLNGIAGDDDPSVQGNTILPYGGHGTFVGGVIRCLAPRAEVVVRCVFDVAGSGLESDFVPKLHEGFRYGAEIFHITVASQTRHNFPLIAFEAWMQDLFQHKGVVCIVAAGNNDSRKPCWPAAFPGLISVGALRADLCRRAYFSNFGSWVDVYAPGQDLVNAFAKGSYTCHVAPHDGEVREFSGMAQWSGTSFSTPIVTGLIAARMARCGESAREAAAALLARARAQAIPGVGPVLFPGCKDDDEHCGHCGTGRRGCGCGRSEYGGGHGGCGCGGHGGHGGCDHGGHGGHGGCDHGGHSGCGYGGCGHGGCGHGGCGGHG
jgi:Subtilase family